jgi:glyoxylase-like metal-dependent hydrolase (beta-lactamase superfamily II)
MADAAEARPAPALTVGVACALSPMVRRIVAPNPGIMTGPGTNTYLVGVDEIAVIDPGPDEPAHLDAIAGCGGDRIRWILVTHTHPDHSPGAAGLAERTGAPVLGFEARDGFTPDETIGEGFTIEATEFDLRAVHTPGHASNHLCYLLEQERLLFSGDHVMQGSTVVISPPDGDMATYLTSLERLQTMRLKAIAPGHGHVIDDPRGVVQGYLDHRREREAQVLALVRDGVMTVDDVVARLYADVNPELHQWARKSVHAHLRKLVDDGLVTTDDADVPEGEWLAR